MYQHFHLIFFLLFCGISWVSLWPPTMKTSSLRANDNRIDSTYQAAADELSSSHGAPRPGPPSSPSSWAAPPRCSTWQIKPAHMGHLTWQPIGSDVSRTPRYLAGAISSSNRVSPGISAAWALMARALSLSSSLRPDVNSWLVVISLGAMPCSLKSCHTTTTKTKTKLNSDL